MLSPEISRARGKGPAACTGFFAGSTVCIIPAFGRNYAGMSVALFSAAHFAPRGRRAERGRCWRLPE